VWYNSLVGGARVSRPFNPKWRKENDRSHRSRHPRPLRAPFRRRGH